MDGLKMDYYANLDNCIAYCSLQNSGIKFVTIFILKTVFNCSVGFTRFLILYG